MAPVGEVAGCSVDVPPNGGGTATAQMPMRGAPVRAEVTVPVIRPVGAADAGAAPAAMGRRAASAVRASAAATRGEGRRRVVIGFLSSSVRPATILTAP